MKKIVRVGLIASLICVMLSASVALAAIVEEADPEDNAAQSTLEELLIGTWRWEEGGTYILVFRPDGTGVSGFPGLRLEIAWRIDGDRLIIDGLDTNIRIHDDRTITLDRYSPGEFYTYIRYSDEYDATTSFWLFLVVGIGLLLLPIVVIVLIVIFVRRRRRRREALSGVERRF